MKRTLAYISALTVFSLAAVAQTTESSWAKFNPGSWQKSKMTVQTTRGRHETTMVIETRQTLVSKTADKGVLEIQTRAMGTTTGAEGNPLTGGVTGTSKPVAPPKMGTDTITLAGKTFKCVTVESQTEANGNQSTVKRWIAEEVPGGDVKIEITTSGATSSRVVVELVDFKAM